MGPLFATDRYCDFDPVDRVVYTWPWMYILLVYPSRTMRSCNYSISDE